MCPTATYQKHWIAPRERLFCLFHLISWGLPCASCLAIVMLKANGQAIVFGGSMSGGWCWIQQWRYDLLGGKVIEMASYLFLAIVYVLSWTEMKRVHRLKSKYKFLSVT